MSRILIVEDEETIADLERDYPVSYTHLTLPTT